MKKPFDKARRYHARIFTRIVRHDGAVVERTVYRRYKDGHFDYGQDVHAESPRKPFYSPNFFGDWL